jgi:hypothetical protein
LVVEPEEVFHGFQGCLWVLEKQMNIDIMCHLPQSRKSMRTRIIQGTIGEFRGFDEEQDEHSIEMRMFAI